MISDTARLPPLPDAFDDPLKVDRILTVSSFGWYKLRMGSDDGTRLRRVISQQIRLTLIGLAWFTFTQSSRAATNLVQYNPNGFLVSTTPLSASSVAPGITAGTLSQVGFGTASNTDAWPVGNISTSPTITLGNYLTFTVTLPAGQIFMFQDLFYTKESYNGHGGTLASIRSSKDGFAADISQLSINPAGVQTIDFNLSSLGQVTGTITFRIYFYGASASTDWDDLIGSNRGGNGLLLTGGSNVPTTPVPPSLWLTLIGLTGAVLYTYCRERFRASDFSRSRTTI
jgi:hypothetical protein